MNMNILEMIEEAKKSAGGCTWFSEKGPIYISNTGEMKPAFVNGLPHFNYEKIHEDVVNDPPHYKGNTLQSIDIIEDFQLGFNLGNAIKYILRCNKKGKKNEDLEKAIWYITREIIS